MSPLEVSPAVLPYDRYLVTEVLPPPKGKEDTVLWAKGYDREIASNVFIKAKNIEEDKDVITKMAREAEVLSSFHHTQIPELTDVNLEGDVPFIATKLKYGDRELNRWFRANSNLDLAADLCMSALVVVEYVHQQGVTHRDIKTSNFVLSWSGEVSLLDFELARYENEETLDIRAAKDVPQTTKHSRATNTTKTNKVTGTADYMSPERAQGDGGTPKSDIYSMGIVFHELLLGRRPFEGTEYEGDVYQTLQPIKFYANGRDVPDEYLAIAEKATQKEPKNRHESATEMKEEIESVKRSLQAT